MRIGSERFGKELCERRLKDWWFESSTPRTEGGGGSKGDRLEVSRHKRQATKSGGGGVRAAWRIRIHFNFHVHHFYMFTSTQINYIHLITWYQFAPRPECSGKAFMFICILK